MRAQKKIEILEEGTVEVGSGLQRYRTFSLLHSTNKVGYKRS
jgi:hypothetical protein